MDQHVIVTAAISNWADGACHATVVVGGYTTDGTPIEETFKVETETLSECSDWRVYARRALAGLLAEL